MNIAETDRLILRQWKAQDLVPFAKINADPRVMEYMPKLLTIEETQTLINSINSHFSIYSFGLYATALKESNEFIGFIGLSVPSFQAKFTPCVEIGWRISFPYWGKGYATEGARAILKLGFEKFSLPKILSWTTHNNARSRRVMEKLHMKHNPNDNFHHPNMPLNHPLALHVLYQINSADFHNHNITF